MIKPELVGQGKWGAASQSLNGWKQHLFLHRNVPEKTPAEFFIGLVVNFLLFVNGPLQEII
jgi:hypothetical protein